MSPETIAAGEIAEVSEPRGTFKNGGTHHIRYKAPEAVRTFNVSMPPQPPEDLRLGLEVVFESGVVYMRAAEVDVSTEAETPFEATRSLVGGIREWLMFLREEQPNVAPNLEPQLRYVELLDYSSVTWFKPVRVG
jgi:hypothetical protein